METDAMRKILESLDREVLSMPDGDPRFRDPRYEKSSLSEENLNPISLPSESERKISFVDGGNAEIISAPTFSVHLVRIYFNLFQGKERIQSKEIPQKIEFYTITVTNVNSKEEIQYKVDVFPLQEIPDFLLPQEEDLTFDSYDKTIKEGIRRGKIEKMGDLARRFGEWNLLAQIASKELEGGDMLVRDGSLQTNFTNESQYSKKAFEICKDKEVLMTGLSKTSSLYTTTGNSLIGVIHKLGKDNLPNKAWYYHPIVKIEHPEHPAEMFCVKLHPKSDYAFRWEVLKEQAQKLNQEKLEAHLGTLALNSRDVSFPGYPYGLVDADSNARVRMNELDYHATLFLSQASKKGRWKNLVNHIKATDAHHHLNKIIGK